MREIKFRAWDSWGKGRMRIVLHVSSSPPADICDFESIIVEQMPLMQYTGLKDKKGVEIYEGDILKNDIWGICGPVEYDRDGYRVKGDDLDVMLNNIRLSRSRVIGNVHENPELLS